MKRIVLVANDVSPSKAFKELAESLSQAGFVVTGYLGMGKLETHESQIVEWIPGASFVLVGMSSSPELAQKELFAIEQAKKHGVPYGLYSDVRAMYRAEHFRVFRDGATLFISFFPEQDDVPALFPNARVCFLGVGEREGIFDPKIVQAHIQECV